MVMMNLYDGGYITTHGTKQVDIFILIPEKSLLCPHAHLSRPYPWPGKNDNFPCKLSTIKDFLKKKVNFSLFCFFINDFDG